MPVPNASFFVVVVDTLEVLLHLENNRFQIIFLGLSPQAQILQFGLSVAIGCDKLPTGSVQEQPVEKRRTLVAHSYLVQPNPVPTIQTRRANHGVI